MRGMRGFAVVCTGLILLACMAAEARDNSGIKTVVVNCDRGDSINQALEDKADELIIEISGTCQEDVVVSRSDVTLRGIDPDTTVDAQANQAIFVDRASRVTLENLTVTGSTGSGIQGAGIYIVHASGVVVSRVSSEGNRYGLRTYGSALSLVDSLFSRNLYAGLYISNGSSLLINGDEINVSENGSYGLCLSESTLRPPWVGNPRLVADDNGEYGVVVQFSASALLNGPVEAKRNGWRGIWVSGGFFYSSSDLEVTNNSQGVLAEGSSTEVSIIGGDDVSIADNTVGLYAGEGARIFFSGTLTGNTGAAAVAEGTGRVSLSYADCHDNGFGVMVRGGTAWIQESTIANNTNGDVDLSFGARATFDGVNTVGVVSCDDTVLVEGDVTCPETKTATSRPALKGWLGPDVAVLLE